VWSCIWRAPYRGAALQLFHMYAMPRSAAQANIGVDFVRTCAAGPRRLLFQATVSAAMCWSADVAVAGAGAAALAAFLA
jgi:hypothetical protein